MNTCPIQGCAVPIRDKDVVCGKHWFKIPAKYQRIIQQAIDTGTLETTPFLIAKHKGIRHVNQRIANEQWGKQFTKPTE